MTEAEFEGNSCHAVTDQTAALLSVRADSGETTRSSIPRTHKNPEAGRLLACIDVVGDVDRAGSADRCPPTPGSPAT